MTRKTTIYVEADTFKMSFKGDDGVAYEYLRFTRSDWSKDTDYPGPGVWLRSSMSQSGADASFMTPEIMWFLVEWLQGRLKSSFFVRFDGGALVNFGYGAEQAGALGIPEMMRTEVVSRPDETKTH